MNVRDALYEAVAVDSAIDDMRIAIEEDDGALAQDVELDRLLETLSYASDAVVRYLQNKERV